MIQTGAGNNNRHSRLKSRATTPLFILLVLLSGMRMTQAQIGVINNTTTNTSSTTHHETDIPVNLPDINGTKHVGGGSIVGKTINLGDTLHIEWTLDHPLGDPKVQAALNAALKVLNAQKPPFPHGATSRSFGGAASSTSTSSSLASTKSPLGTNTTVTNTVSIGPQTVLFGTDMSQSLFVTAGNTNINTNTAFESFFLNNLQRTNLTTITDGHSSTTIVQRILFIDLNAVYSAMFSGLPVALAQRESLVNAHAGGIGDVNSRNFRAWLGPNDSEPPQGDGSLSDDLRCFASGNVGWLSQDAGDTTAGLRDTREAASVGAEWKIHQAWRLGFAVSYMHGDTDFSDDLGKQQIDGGALSVYATWRKEHFYADLLYSAGLFNDTTSRNTLAHGTASGSADDWSHLVSLSTGYVFQVNDTMATGPYASLTYVHGHLDGYDEHGGGTAALSYGAQDYDSLVSSVGWQASWKLHTNCGALTPLVHLGWERENLNDAGDASATLMQSPFGIINGGSLTRFGGFGIGSARESARYDALVLGAALSADINERWNVILSAAERTDFGPRHDFSLSLTAQYKF